MTQITFQLNPEQSQAVRYIDGPLLVLAGAGSGKTRVITEKIAWLIQRCDIKAYNICAVTFTNKAAREMKERVGKMLDREATKGLTVSTFHTLGLNIIRREIGHLNLKKGFSIFDAQDSQTLLKDLLMQQSRDSSFVDIVQHTISNWKNDFISPQQALSLAKSEGEQTIALCYERYNEALRAYNAVDFDDLISLPVTLFEQQPEVLQKWQRRIHYMLVDEYQDTNISQYRLVRQLVGTREGLTAVGDDDQSIYAWRGARPENLSQLETDFANLRIIKLEQNYRSAGRILKAANTLIANNPHTFEKKLWSELGYGDPIRVLQLKSEDEEAERIAVEILQKRLHRQADFRDFAVLYRGNHQSRILEIKLQQHQLPYNISGGQSFFARSEIKDIMAYLRLLVNPEDDNAFLRIINTPRRKIGPSTLEKLAHYAQQRGASLYLCIDELGLESHVGKAASEKLQRFAHWLDQVRANCHSLGPMAALREMVDDMGYDLWLQQNSSSPQAAEKRLENVYYLLDSIQQSIAKDEDREDSGDAQDQIERAVNKLLLQDLLDQQQEEDLTDRVQLMTLHAAKGLEFPHVYIMGMEEALLPHRSSIEEDNIEEERRLAYVGLTRAQRTLTLTLAEQRKQFGETVDCSPSRFIEELPQDDLEWEGGQVAMSEEQQQAKAQSTLSSLKGLFD